MIGLWDAVLGLVGRGSCVVCGRRQSANVCGRCRPIVERIAAEHVEHGHLPPTNADPAQLVEEAGRWPFWSAFEPQDDGVDLAPPLHPTSRDLDNLGGPR